MVLAGHSGHDGSSWNVAKDADKIVLKFSFTHCVHWTMLKTSKIAPTQYSNGCWICKHGSKDSFSWLCHFRIERSSTKNIFNFPRKFLRNWFSCVLIFIINPFSFHTRYLKLWWSSVMHEPLFCSTHECLEWLSSVRKHDCYINWDTIRTFNLLHEFADPSWEQDQLMFRNNIWTKLSHYILSVSSVYNLMMNDQTVTWWGSCCRLLIIMTTIVIPGFLDSSRYLSATSFTDHRQAWSFTPPLTIWQNSESWTVSLFYPRVTTHILSTTDPPPVSIWEVFADNRLSSAPFGSIEHNVSHPSIMMIRKTHKLKAQWHHNKPDIERVKRSRCGWNWGSS